MLGFCGLCGLRLDGGPVPVQILDKDAYAARALGMVAFAHCAQNHGAAFGPTLELAGMFQAWLGLHKITTPWPVLVAGESLDAEIDKMECYFVSFLASLHPAPAAGGADSDSIPIKSGSGVQ